MLKNLRRKFILTNMLLVGIVLAVVFTSICVNTYSIQKAEIDRTLSAPFTESNYGENEFGFLASMVVLADSNGRPLETITRGATLDRDTLEYVVAKAMNSKSDKGSIKEKNLFFEKAGTIGSSTAIVFVDSSRFYDIIKRTFGLASVSFVLAMILVYFVSRFLAGIAIKPVEEAWDRQKQFIADASHELKTPLTVILANSDILQSRKDSTINQEKQWIESTVDEARHMKALVEDMLFLARHDSNGIVYEKSYVNMTELVEGNVLQMEPLAYEKGIEFFSDVNTDIGMTASVTQMRQLMHILLDNAIKYSKPSESLITAREDGCLTSGEKKSQIGVSLYRNEKAGTIELTIANTGDIMDSNETEHIFDRFYRSDKARTKDEEEAADGSGKTGGYGLGLAIAKAIVEEHNGTIEAKSGPDVAPEGRAGLAMYVTFRG